MLRVIFLPRKTVGGATVFFCLLCCALLSSCRAQGAHKSIAVGGPVPVRLQGVPQSGLIADVPFTEQSGTVAGDRSGNGNYCTFGEGINAPTWNGIGIAEGPQPDGQYGNQYCTFPATLPAAARSVAVCAYLPTGQEMSALVGNQPGLNGVISFASLLGAQNRAGLSLMMQAPLGTARVYYQQSAYFDYGGFSSATNDMSIGWNCFFYVFGSSTDTPSTVDRLYKNGVEVSSYAFQTGSERYLPLTGMWYLGGGGFAPSLQFVGTFEHVLAWDRMLSPSEVGTAWQALQAEMVGRGVSFSSAGSQATDSVADCLGDSQTVGANGATSWCTDSNLKLPANTIWQLKNNAESGTTCVSMESGFPREEALDWSPHSPHSALLLYCGINDINVGGEKPAEIWSRQLAICQLARKAGYESVLDVTLPSWVNQDANVQGTNALIRANWQSCFSSVVDLANDPRFGATGAFTNSTYFQQGAFSHLNSAGEAVLGQYASDNLASLYGSDAKNVTAVETPAYAMKASDNVVVEKAKATTITLPDCLGYPPGHTRVVINGTAGAVGVLSRETEGINGSQLPLLVRPGSQQQFVVQLVSPTEAGCTWLAQTAS